MSFAAVQKHVAVLERSGLVAKEARGRERFVRGNPTRSSAPRPSRLLRTPLASRIDQLDALLAD